MSAKRPNQPQLLASPSVNDPNRCQHRTPSGRRCKLPVESHGQPFCYTHAVQFQKADLARLKTPLLEGHQGFQTAQGINNSLGNLYKLLANNQISPRRASVLAFISSMLLRTLPAIDADQAAGIIDPTAPAKPDEGDHHTAASAPDEHGKDADATGDDHRTASEDDASQADAADEDTEHTDTTDDSAATLALVPAADET